MFQFKIIKKSKKSNARIGRLITSHGKIETPSFVGVATQATIKTLDSKEIPKTGMQMMISNTYHLHLRPGEDVIKKNGGLNKFMDYQGPTMTDSGGFQVFSLGFGRDYGTGKILKQSRYDKITVGAQPKLIKITEDGVEFKSYIDGKKLFLGPKESIQIQEKIGADIIFAFDECTSPITDYEYTKKSLEKTHRWAKICLSSRSFQGKKKQALYGIVQGGKYKDLRIESAKFIGSLPFNGFGIGGEFGDEKEIMTKMLKWVNAELPEEKPRHLLGIGHLEDIPKIIKEGIDTFDCITPTHYARHGYAFIKKPTTNNQQLTTKHERLDLNKTKYLNDLSPLDKNCQCYVCKNYTKSYLHHLLKANELTVLKLLSFHNLYYFNNFVKNIRDEIKKDKI